MSHLIILAAAEADKVRGKSFPMAAIEPIPLEDGTFMLGVEVLADPAHAAQSAFLALLPKATVAEKKAVMFDGDAVVLEQIAQQANAQQAETPAQDKALKHQDP